MANVSGSKRNHYQTDKWELRRYVLDLYVNYSEESVEFYISFLRQKFTNFSDNDLYAANMWLVRNGYIKKQRRHNGRLTSSETIVLKQCDF